MIWNKYNSYKVLNINSIIYANERHLRDTNLSEFMDLDELQI